jgi:D-alanyl-D-alanine carboxypeptidase/D-alanyl-D-alanine-endopeptidase (penicillin-binding protein 4)
MKWLVFLSLGALLPGGAGAEVLRELPAEVARILSAHGMAPDSYSAWVQAVDDPAPLLAVNPDTPRNPASTIKLLTTFLALEDLGPAYTWPTEAYVNGQVREGRLAGDLYIKGYGDPYMVTERLWLFLRGLRQRGLLHVDGDLVIDGSFFALAPEDPGAFDGQAYRVYNAGPDAFLVNFKAINFVLRPDPLNNRVDVVADPQPANLNIRNQVQLADGRCASQGGIQVAVAEPVGGNQITFSGQMGRRCGEVRLSRALQPGPEYAYGVVRGLWEESGGTISGGFRQESVPDGLELFYGFDSPPLSDVIRAVNKWSNNVMTRQIFLTMGAARFGPPATVEKSREAAAASLAARGLEFPELRLDNGAGLSRDTRISARSLARLLLAAHDSPFRSEFESSLAVAGVDGTLRRRFRNEALTGQMHLKTGRLNGVFAMAGYVRNQAGQELVVVAIQNHRDAHRGPAEETHSQLLRWAWRQPPGEPRPPG